jgi:glycosyltransferase involved in cell wall biosynthesis
MRLLTICHEYPPIGGGGATASEILAERLAENDHQVDILTAGMRGLPRREVRRGVTIHRAPSWRRRLHYSTTSELATWIVPALRLGATLARQHDYDLIHCHFIVPGGVVAAILATRFKLPLVLTAHGSDVPGYNPDRFARTHRLIGRGWSRILAASAALTVPSAHLAGLLASATDRPITIIPNPFEPLLTQRVEARADRILVVARLVERKGVQTLLAALEGLATDCEVVVAGDGPYLEPLRALARERAVPTRFLGFVSRAELSRQYATARIFAFPSIQENFPMVLLEAMAHGCAVVTTNAPGCAEVVGDAALTVPPGDVAALRAAIDRMVADNDLVAELGRRGIERVRCFASARIAAEYERLFATVQAQAAPNEPATGVMGSVA